MKIVNFILGLVAALTLIEGGFSAGAYITQTHTANIPAQQPAQPIFIPLQEQCRPGM